MNQFKRMSEEEADALVENDYGAMLGVERLADGSAPWMLQSRDYFVIVHGNGAFIQTRARYEEEGSVQYWKPRIANPTSQLQYIMTSLNFADAFALIDSFDARVRRMGFVRVGETCTPLYLLEEESAKRLLFWTE